MKLTLMAVLLIACGPSPCADGYPNTANNGWCCDANWEWCVDPLTGERYGAP